MNRNWILTILITIIILSAARIAFAQSNDEPAGGFPPQTQAHIRVQVQDADTIVGEDVYVKIQTVNGSKGISGGSLTLVVPTNKFDFAGCSGCFVPPIVEQSENGGDHLIHFGFLDLARKWEGRGDFHVATIILTAKDVGHPFIGIKAGRIDDDNGDSYLVNTVSGTVFIFPKPIAE
jgi:hypothetical protein